MHETMWVVVLISALLNDNILLTHFLGLCPFLACSRRLDTAFGLGLAVTFVITCTTVLNHVLYHQVLVRLGLEHLKYLFFIAVIAAFVQLLEIIFERFFRRLHVALGIFLPLITVNCAILGTTLFMVIRDYDFIRTVAYALGSGAGWMLAIVLMAGLRSRLVEERVPGPFRGVPIAMILAGIMAMVFRGFVGLGA